MPLYLWNIEIDKGLDALKWVPEGYKMSGWNYDHEKLQNGIPWLWQLRYIDTWYIKLVGVIVCVDIPLYSLPRLKLDKAWLPWNEPLGTIQWISVKIFSKQLQKWIPWSQKHRYRQLYQTCNCLILCFMPLRAYTPINLNHRIAQNVWLLQNRSLGAVKWVCVKIWSNLLQ